MPLALSDPALARLIIAAGGVPRRQRGVFLRDFARCIEDGVDPRQAQKKRVENARRQAKRRQREREGRDRWCLDVAETESFRIAEAVVRCGRLTAEQALDRQLVEHELARVVVQWATEWIEKG